MLLSLLLAAQAASLPPCRVVDGDTLNCAGERVRLLAIDAPEKRGRCRPGRICAPGDPTASTASLLSGMRHGPLTITRISRDRYGRTLALVRSGSTDLSCWQLSQRQAIYRAAWDDGGSVKRICPSLAR